MAEVKFIDKHGNQCKAVLVWAVSAPEGKLFCEWNCKFWKICETFPNPQGEGTLGDFCVSELFRDHNHEVLTDIIRESDGFSLLSLVSRKYERNKTP